MSDNETPEEDPAEKIPPLPELFATDTTEEEYFLAEQKAAQAAALKKRKIIFFSGGGFLCVLILLMLYSCQPPKGTIMYGVCGALLEQLVSYPPSVQHLYVEQFPRVVRIYFNQMDAFGQFTQDMIECSADEKKFPNLYLKSVTYNRKAIDAKVLERFNKTIPVIIASEPDLTLPEPPEVR